MKARSIEFIAVACSLLLGGCPKAGDGEGDDEVGDTLGESASSSEGDSTGESDSTDSTDDGDSTDSTSDSDSTGDSDSTDSTGDDSTDSTGDGDGDPPGLACDSVALLGAPIALDTAPTGWSQASAAPVLWRGSTQELVVARSIPMNPQTMVLQLRDIEGTLLDEPFAAPLHDWFYCNGNAALAWNETLGQYLFADAGGAGNDYWLMLQAFDEQGNEQWADRGRYVCNNILQGARIHPVDDAFYVLGAEFHCGWEPRDMYVDVWDGTGERIEQVETGHGYYGDIGCLDPDCTTAYSVRAGNFPPDDLINGLSRTWGQVFDLSQFVVEPEAVQLGPENLQGAGVGGNGQHYLVVTGHYASQTSTNYRFRLIEPDGTVLPDELQIAHPHRPLYFEVLWTGDGWLVATGVWEHNGSGLADNWTDYQIRVWHLAPDMTLRETFLLDDQPSLSPKLALLPGKVAITWVRPGSDTIRLLGFLGC